MDNARLVKGVLILLGLVIMGFGLMKLFASFSPTADVIAVGNLQSLGVDQINQGNEEQSSGEFKEFNLRLFQFGFDPSIITVNKGDKVRLVMTSLDVVHGLALFEFNVNERVYPDKTKTVEFIADKAGTFYFYCSIPCGSGHGTMKGVLIVN